MVAFASVQTVLVFFSPVPCELSVEVCGFDLIIHSRAYSAVLIVRRRSANNFMMMIMETMSKRYLAFSGAQARCEIVKPIR